MKKILYRVLMVICLGIFCFSAWQLYSIWKGGNQIQEETAALEQYLKPASSTSSSSEEQKEDTAGFEPDWAGLQAQNPNIVGWIVIPDTDISFPVVQGSDNEYYLDHTVLGEYNYRGSIFMDADASRDLTDDNTLIYGHSVDIGGMFTDLKKYESESFFEEHPYFWLLTPSENYRCEVVYFTQADDSSAVYTTSFGDYQNTVLGVMSSQALYTRDVENPDGYPMVSLSTCNLDYGYHSNQRLVLSALLVPFYGDVILQ